HDAWLSKIELIIQGKSSDEAVCARDVRIDLLNAYHNGIISFIYRGVLRHKIFLNMHETPGKKICRRHDWLEDLPQSIGDDHLRHTIRWEGEEWIIDAREVIYQWVCDKAENP